jgi:hypothetical protein
MWKNCPETCRKKCQGDAECDSAIAADAKSKDKDQRCPRWVNYCKFNDTNSRAAWSQCVTSCYNECFPYTGTAASAAAPGAPPPRPRPAVQPARPRVPTLEAQGATKITAADKKLYDPKNYWHKELKNGVKVLIIENADIEDPIVSVGTNVGYLDDPDKASAAKEDRPGFTRFFQNALFHDGKGNDMQMNLGANFVQHVGDTLPNNILSTVEVKTAGLTNAIKILGNSWSKAPWSNTQIGNVKDQIQAQIDDRKQVYDKESRVQIQRVETLLKHNVTGDTLNTWHLVSYPGQVKPRQSRHSSDFKSFAQNVIQCPQNIVVTVEAQKNLAQVLQTVEASFNARKTRNILCSEQRPSLIKTKAVKPNTEKLAWMKVNDTKADPYQVSISFMVPSANNWEQSPELIKHLLDFEIPAGTNATGTNVARKINWDFERYAYGGDIRARIELYSGEDWKYVVSMVLRYVETVLKPLVDSEGRTYFKNLNDKLLELRTVDWKYDLAIKKEKKTPMKEASDRVMRIINDKLDKDTIKTILRPSFETDIKNIQAIVGLMTKENMNVILYNEDPKTTASLSALSWTNKTDDGKYGASGLKYRVLDGDFPDLPITDYKWENSPKSVGTAPTFPADLTAANFKQRYGSEGKGLGAVPTDLSKSKNGPYGRYLFRLGTTTPNFDYDAQFTIFTNLRIITAEDKAKVTLFEKAMELAYAPDLKKYSRFDLSLKVDPLANDYNLRMTLRLKGIYANAHIKALNDLLYLMLHSTDKVIGGKLEEDTKISITKGINDDAEDLTAALEHLQYQYDFFGTQHLDALKDITLSSAFDFVREALVLNTVRIDAFAVGGIAQDKMDEFRSILANKVPTNSEKKEYTRTPRRVNDPQKPIKLTLEKKSGRDSVGLLKTISAPKGTIFDVKKRAMVDLAHEMFKKTAESELVDARENREVTASIKVSGDSSHITLKLLVEGDFDDISEFRDHELKALLDGEDSTQLTEAQGYSIDVFHRDILSPAVELYYSQKKSPSEERTELQQLFTNSLDGSPLCISSNDKSLAAVNFQINDYDKFYNEIKPAFSALMLDISKAATLSFTASAKAPTTATITTTAGTSTPREIVTDTNEAEFARVRGENATYEEVLPIDQQALESRTDQCDAEIIYYNA